MRPIHRLLREQGLTLAANPCISPDFCLDWERLRDRLDAGDPVVRLWEPSACPAAAGTWHLAEDHETGDCAWCFTPGAGSAPEDWDGPPLAGADGRTFFPCTWDNLLRLKNLLQEHDATSTVFPVAAGSLREGTIGVGARFTTLHWPAVDWAMAALGRGLTANQNSIPRELVYDVDAMLAGRLETVPFPFIGTSVPEGHQGQSVEGMSHGAVLAKVRHGFHRRRIAWSFNADHQPIGGRFDAREDALVRGCLLASYITFDLSPELALGPRPEAPALPPAVVAAARDRVAAVGIRLDDGAFADLLKTVGPAILKMKRRDDFYRAARAAAFTTAVGRDYARELSIDELPGLTPPATTAVLLALCEALGMRVDFVAPAFGFQKNTPYPDNAELRHRVEAQWDVVRRFGASIGFHSGSGKSAENYAVLGAVTGGRLEIKTSGRYTYEMGVALAGSSEPEDQALWRDWYRFTCELALAGAFAEDETERRMARHFILASLPAGAAPEAVFATPASARTALLAVPPSPDHMVFFEYNFLYVLAAGGRPEKAALGDHGAAGYAQRARFYRISAEARLRYARGVASYLIFLARSTGLVEAERCDAAARALAGYRSLDDLLGAIATVG